MSCVRGGQATWRPPRVVWVCLYCWQPQLWLIRGYCQMLSFGSTGRAANICIPTVHVLQPQCYRFNPTLLSFFFFILFLFLTQIRNILDAIFLIMTWAWAAVGWILFSTLYLAGCAYTTFLIGTLSFCVNLISDIQKMTLLQQRWWLLFTN